MSQDDFVIGRGEVIQVLAIGRKDDRYCLIGHAAQVELGQHILKSISHARRLYRSNYGIVIFLCSDWIAGVAVDFKMFVAALVGAR